MGEEEVVIDLVPVWMWPLAPDPAFREGFMPGRTGDGRAVDDVQFFADGVFMPIGKLIALRYPTVMCVHAHPETWALAGANNLASAYRPDGLL